MLQVSPDDLKGEFDIDVNAEIGVGKKQQTIQNLQLYLGTLAPAGMQLGAVTPGEWAKAAQKLLREMGIRDPQSYVLDPELVKQQFFMQLMQQQMLQEQQAAQQQEQLQRDNQRQDAQLRMQQEDHAANLLERAANHANR